MKTMQPTIRQMLISDIDDVYGIERRSHSAPWSKLTFQRELMSNTHNVCLLAEIGDRVVGFICLYYVLDEGHLTNVAVDEPYRNMGIATQMLLRVIDEVVDKGIHRLTLEVRRSNAPAQYLYIKFGFKMKGLRKGYYTNNNEDALIFWTDDITSFEYQQLLYDIRTDLELKFRSQ